MRIAPFLMYLALAQTVDACELPVCLVDPQSLALTRIITFEEAQSSFGPGYQVKGLLILEGARFGELFAGQNLLQQGNHDQVEGDPLSPLTLLAGDPNAGLSIVRMSGNNVLNGYGASGFPKREAQGEGAIAWLFDDDQAALSFQVRGGEGGQGQASFFRRDGSLISTMDLSPLAEHELGFIRQGEVNDIAGVILTNIDPEGVALDNLRFGRPPDIS
jgi:hypothetical protein